MQEYKNLFKWQLKNYFKSDENKKNVYKSKILMVSCLAIGFIPLIILICISLYNITPAIISYGLFNQFLTVIIGFSQIAVFVFGLFSILGHMYFSKDNEFLSSLPVKSSTIFLSKLSIVYLTELFISVIILLPSLITIGISAIRFDGAINSLYYIMIPITILLSPVFPLLLVSIVSIPMMYIVTFFKKRSTLAGMVGIFIFASFMALYFYFATSTSSSGQLSPEAIVQQLSNSINTMYKIFIFNAPISMVMQNCNTLVNLLIYFVSIISIVGLTLILAQHMYHRALTVLLETNNNENSKIKDFSEIESINKAIIKRDLKSSIREPGLAFNLFMGTILSPIVLSFIANMFSSSNANEGQDDMGAINNMLSGEYASFIIVSIIICYLLMILCSTNFIALIGISREGDKFYINKYLPIDYKKLMNSKIILSCIVSFVGVLLSCIATVIFIDGFGILDGLFMFISLFILACGFNYLGLYRDLKNPKLQWNTIQEITKRNFNTIIPMLLGMVLGFIEVIFSILLVKLQTPIIVCWIFLWLYGIIVGTILILIFKHKIDKESATILENLEC